MRPSEESAKPRGFNNSKLIHIFFFRLFSSHSGLPQCENCQRKKVSQSMAAPPKDSALLKEGKMKKLNWTGIKLNCQKLKNKSLTSTPSSPQTPPTSALTSQPIQLPNANKLATPKQATPTILTKLPQITLPAPMLDHSTSTNASPATIVANQSSPFTAMPSAPNTSAALVLENSPLGNLLVFRMDQRPPLLDFTRLVHTETHPSIDQSH